jgi:hypothetical protein
MDVSGEFRRNRPSVNPIPLGAQSRLAERFSRCSLKGVAVSSRRTSKPKLAAADPLKREVQAVLDPTLADDRYRSGHGRYDGYGYVAAEAYFLLAGGDKAGLRPMQLTYRRKSHWWLLDSAGQVVDLALGPGESSDFPYHRGTPRRFRWTPAGISRAAETVVNRVLDARESVS